MAKMSIGELVASLHNEIAKSYGFITEMKGDNTEGAVLHISLERAEIELPVIMSEMEVEYDPETVKDLPISFRRLRAPMTPRVSALPETKVKGNTVAAEIVGHLEKLDDRITSDRIGRIKLVFKLVAS